MTDLLLAIIVALLSGISYFVKKIFDKTDSLESSFQPVVPAIVEIQGKFTQSGHSILFPLTVTPGSPLKLTEYGEELMQNSGFKKIIDDPKQRKVLVDFVKAMNPRTAYDVQECSARGIQKLLDNNNPVLVPLKDYAYNNGLSLEVLVQPAGILLRDRVLKELDI